MAQRTGPDEGQTIKLPAVVDRQAAAELLPVLRHATASGSVLIDGSDVERIGQAGLQLVLSALASSATLRAVSPALCAAADLAGVELEAAA